jgi:hypothetical protein
MHTKPILDPTNLIRATQAESRAAAQLQEQQRIEARRAELIEQSAAHLSPAERIAVWERVHALSLPKRADHPLLATIAAQTQLTLSDVAAEQARRTKSLV